MHLAKSKTNLCCILDTTSKNISYNFKQILKTPQNGDTVKSLTYNFNGETKNEETFKHIGAINCANSTSSF